MSFPVWTMIHLVNMITINWRSQSLHAGRFQASQTGCSTKRNRRMDCSPEGIADQGAHSRKIRDFQISVSITQTVQQFSYTLHIVLRVRCPPRSRLSILWQTARSNPWLALFLNMLVLPVEDLEIIYNADPVSPKNGGLKLWHKHGNISQWNELYEVIDRKKFTATKGERILPLLPESAYVLCVFLPVVSRHSQ